MSVIMLVFHWIGPYVLTARHYQSKHQHFLEQKGITRTKAAVVTMESSRLGKSLIRNTVSVISVRCAYTADNELFSILQASLSPSFFESRSGFIKESSSDPWKRRT
jgi:hypothetical protein